MFYLDEFQKRLKDNLGRREVRVNVTWADKQSRATQNRILAAELGQSVKETCVQLNPYASSPYYGG